MGDRYTLHQKLAVLFGGLAAAFALASATILPVQMWVSAVGAKLHSFGSFGVILFATMYVAGAMAFVPASAFSLVAGLIYGVWGIPLAWLSMMAVAATSFPLARCLLATHVTRLVDERRFLHTVAEVIDEEGWRMVLLVRVSGIVPFGLQNYIFGVTHIAFVPYLLATSVGVLPSILLYTGAGAFGNAAIEGGETGLLRPILLTGVVLAALALVMITGRKVRARLKEQKA